MRKSARSAILFGVGSALFLALPIGAVSAANFMGGQFNPGGPCIGCGNFPPPVIHQPAPPIIFWPIPPVHRPGPPVAHPLSLR
jgi:hypothetical protein